MIIFFVDHPIKWELSGNEYNHQMGAIDTIEFSDHSVSSWGGMKCMKDLLDAGKTKEQLASIPLPEKGSNRGYEPTQILECFWTSVWIGAGRFSHSAYLR
jgi:hypothetical protein